MEQRPSAAGAVRQAFARRVRPGQLLTEESAAIARCCHDMAVRFHRGGTLLVFGNGGASTDAQHIAVEFVHPVIVGKRALPAMSLTNDVATVTGVGRQEGFAEVFAHQLRQLAAPHDIALGISADGRCENVRRGLRAAREAGLLTVLLRGGDGGGLAAGDAVDHAIVVRSTDPRIVKELHVTVYHVLWELVHVFFEQPGLLDPPDREAVR
jgi:D-sedoheptulose 7-phosphate isomerase